MPGTRLVPLLSLGARASRPHKTWQGRGDWLHRVGRFTRRLALEQRLDKYAGGTPALPGGNLADISADSTIFRDARAPRGKPMASQVQILSRALFCRSILPPSHARLRILQKARVGTNRRGLAHLVLLVVESALKLKHWDPNCYERHLDDGVLLAIARNSQVLNA